ncbi:hypothetical protein HMPREF9554_01851 [Treponema phagedenis F0421]|nr:hypothetical protein HMPREF9554_01851 [Treponema phagedenis F0421]
MLLYLKTKEKRKHLHENHRLYAQKIKTYICGCCGLKFSFIRLIFSCRSLVRINFRRNRYIVFLIILSVFNTPYKNQDNFIKKSSTQRFHFAIRGKMKPLFRTNRRLARSEFCRPWQNYTLRVLKLWKQSCFKTSLLRGTTATHLFLVFLIKSVLRV